MVFQTLSSFAWLAVIAIQAFIHFVVAPRYTSTEVVKDEPDRTEPCNSSEPQIEELKDESNKTESKNNSYSTMETMSESFDDGDTMSLDGVESSTTSSLTKLAVHRMEMDDIDPDERDSVDESSSSGIQSPNTELDRSTSHITECDPQDQTKNKTKKEIRVEGIRRVRSNSSPEMNHDDDCIDEDEEWRYNLIKDYYANSYFHMMSGAATNMDETAEEEDPALLPVGTINTLSEKLRQQRRLSEIRLRSQRNTRSVSFDHSPVSVIATY